PLSMSLINDYFTVNERTKMMGYNSAFSNFCVIVTMLLAGWLATFGWRIPFNVYFLGLVIFILIFFFLPKAEIQQPEENKKKSKLPISAIEYSLAMAAIMLAYYSISTNISLFLEQNEICRTTLERLVV